MLLFAHMGLALLFARPFKKADLTFLAIGSMLPDIIDKPLGTILFGTPGMGRIFAHTLLFLFVIAALAVFLRDIRLVSLCGGVFIHLALDTMWNSPVILFWPLLGPFPIAHYVSPLDYLEMLMLGLKNPGIWIPECIGLAYLIYFAAERKPRIYARIKSILAR
ncbi:MAG: metal-dependent hydrolase [Methanothrix sp.]|nr:MAG: metal-dependent hydrolase [Methanothrix sp.]